MATQNEILHDLMIHLTDKIGNAIGDYYDRCATVGLEEDSVNVYLMTALGFYLSATATEIQITEQEYLAMSRWHFHKTMEAA